MKKVKYIIKPICFLILLFTLLSYATYVLRNKNEADIVLPYYSEPRDSLDVVFVGSSHIMCGVYPMELWNDYGVASYNFASSAQVLPQSYYQVREALRTQTPKLMVIDCSGAVYDSLLGSTDYVHVQFDNMRLSPVKFMAINDLVKNKKDRLEYYFNIYKFHSRWKEIKPYDFAKISGTTKGAHINTAVVKDSTNIEIIPQNDTTEMYDNVKKYLIKIIELCKENNIETLLLSIPSCSAEQNQRRYNEVYKIADEYGLTYLNLMYYLDEMNFDFTTDMNDLYHCNTSGAKKVTQFLGKYFSENYDLPDRRTDPDYKYWEKQYSEYKQKYVY